MDRASLTLAPAIAAALFGLVPGAARADLIDLIPQLRNPIEIAAARANQSVYDSLTTAGENRTPICDPFLTADPGEGGCTGEVFRVFDRVRHLVHTANELTGEGPTTFSLRVDRARLGRALRWTAAEELAAQGTAATRFAGSQLNSLASRIAALRFGARGPRVVALDASAQERFAAREGARLGGGASADELGAARWGGFIDGSLGYGRHADTTNRANPGSEDAFDYDGVDATAGVDYRFGPRTAAGVIVGYTRRGIDFDSRVSVVDGAIDSDGESIMAYLLWEGDALYLSASLGAQTLDHELRRRIAYASLNPLVASVDETAFSSTRSDTLLGGFNIGYSWRRGAFSLEPFLRTELQTIDIEGFSERNANGFDLTYGEQTIESLDAALGLKLQHVFTPRFGVFIPFLRAEFHRDFADERRTIDAVYSGVIGELGLTGAQNFDVATNAPDNEFYLGAAGFSLVFKGGVQAFLQYQQTFALEHIDDRAVAGGVRLEF